MKPTVVSLDFETATVVSLDFETALTTGEPSVDYYRPDFRAISAAFSWDSGSKTCSGEREIRQFLAILDKHSLPLVAHNYSFEYGVLLCRFPGFEHLVKYDTARLVQMADNGGGYAYAPEESDSMDAILNELEGVKEVTGLSLQSCASRWLPKELHNHKERFYALIRERSGIAGKEGSRLNFLTDAEMIEYNLIDAEVTLTLYNTLVEHFEDKSIDWQLDHTLYTSSARLIAKAKIAGVLVDRESATLHVQAKQGAIWDIQASFREQFKPQIAELEAEYTQRARDAYKTQRGKDGVKPVEFNPLSTKQMADLFVGKLGITPRFTTEKGAPSFKSKFLSQWGEGGQLLKAQRTHLIEMKQGEKLLEKSELDSRWHLDLRATGTKTNRFAGSGGLNVQGLSRRCESLMSCIQADPGETIVSIDLSAGEPTVTTHYSKDANYYAANFGMIKKEPYYNDAGLLQISDIYLMTASVSPIGSDKVRDAFNSTYGGLTFAEKWVEDDEYLKGELTKEVRSLHKILCLGLSYGMGPKKLVKTAYEAGYELSMKDAKAFFRLYWSTFPGVHRLGDYLANLYKKQGYLQTAFGYSCYPDAEYKSLNAFIQASVSGIMHVLMNSITEINEQYRFITCIHDEMILSAPTEKLLDLKSDLGRCVDSLNSQLDWSVQIRTGFAPGNNFYEAK